MILKNLNQIEKQNVTMAGAEKVQMQLLCGPGDGCPTFAMRKFIVAPGGCTPRHQHDYEHEILVLSGEGIVFGNGKEQPLKPGDVLYVPANEPHQFKNNAGIPLHFICLVPAFVHKPGAPQPTLVDCACDPAPAA
jgi:quercetin dioxygenase-like cupin family protein